MYYSTGQVAFMLGISGPRVRQLINDGELLCERIPVSGIARVSTENFQAFCEEYGFDPRRIKKEGAYTVKKVAEIAGVAVPTVRKWIAAGRLNSFGARIGYCKVFPSELEKFLKLGHKVESRRSKVDKEGNL